MEGGAEVHTCPNGSTFHCEGGAPSCVDNAPEVCNLLETPHATSATLASAQQLPRHGHKPNITVIYWPTDQTGWAVFGRMNCPLSNCEFTGDRARMHEKDTRGFIWQASALDPTDLPIPRAHWHEWILYNRESPCNYDHILMADKLMQLFNLTATISPRSSWPVRPQEFMKFESQQNSFSKLYADLQPTDIKTKNKKRAEGFAPAIYVQTHCDAETDRDAYVKELMKYMKVDSYGPCVHNKDFPSTLVGWGKLRDNDFFQLVSQYKFSLAFENCECDNYVTEKVLRPWIVGSVPVYRGSPTVDEWAPSPNSLIKVNDFKSAKELAAFLKYLDRNNTAYNEYLSYKLPGGFNNPHLTKRQNSPKYGIDDGGQGFGICKLCDELAKHRKLDDTGQSYTHGSRQANRIGQATDWMKCLAPRLDYFHRIIADDKAKYDKAGEDAAEQIWRKRRSQRSIWVGAKPELRQDQP